MIVSSSAWLVLRRSHQEEKRRRDRIGSVNIMQQKERV
jgi:hypothetical protein